MCNCKYKIIFSYDLSKSKIVAVHYVFIDYVNIKCMIGIQQRLGRRNWN